MAVTAKDVADLRARTGAGMMDCKKALEESNGDMNAAADLLRKKGIAKADKRADRAASPTPTVIPGTSPPSIPGIRATTVSGWPALTFTEPGMTSMT